MGPILLFILSIYQLHTTTHSEILNANPFNENPVAKNEDDFSLLIPPEVEEFPDNNAEMPFVKTGHDQTEVEFRHPISSVNIDYSKNMIVMKFRKGHPKLRFKLDPEEDEKRKSLDDNFMRFGRSPADFMRFGKRQIEEMPLTNSIDSSRYYEKSPGERQERSTEGLRDSRGDNFMRFGRAPADFMRFGRGSNDFMRFGRDPNKDFMRFGRDPNKDFMRFGRDPNKDFMRFGRDPNKDFMRFGRDPNKDFMRFGRDPNKDFMRFGRMQKQWPRINAERNFIRYGRPDNFMRFGRNAPETSDTSTNFMRFGKSNYAANKQNQTKSMLQKNDLREAAKLLHENDKDADESNPMDKAIKVLFSKQHQQEQAPQQAETDSQQKNSEETMELDTDYSFNMAE